MNEKSDESLLINSTEQNASGEEMAQNLPQNTKNTEVIKTYRKNPWSVFFKRFFDIILSLLGIIILSPLLLVLSIVVYIKLDKKVFFST